MHIIIIPIGFVLWYMAYETKPILNTEENLLLDQENMIKRKKLMHILEGNFKT
tara:strand:- start:260 stop:418 length:159 start_codon:yes stop_codon:yes gene_type:complete